MKSAKPASYRRGLLA